MEKVVNEYTFTDLASLGLFVKGKEICSLKEGDNIFRRVGDVNFRIEKENSKLEHVFFVWIGQLNIEKMKYLKIWHKSYKELTIWIDERTILCSMLPRVINSIMNRKKCTKINAENFFFETCNRISCKEILDFIEIYTPELKEIAINSLKEHFTMKESLIKNYKIKNIFKEGVLSDEYLFSAYKQEVLLRNNLAAASDIARLSILYKFGGVYIDVDTLPDFRPVFKNVYKLINRKKINLNLVDAYLSTIYYKYVAKENESNAGALGNECFQYIRQQAKEFDDVLRCDLAQWDGSAVIFNPPTPFDNLLCIAANYNKFNEFNNNIIACKKGSKSVKIIIIEMKRRYKYINARNFNLLNGSDFINQKLKNDYYERMVNYRDDKTEVRGNLCTLVLSGPTLILEVIFGISSSLLKCELDDTTLAALIRNTSIGLSFVEHVMYTLEHLDSSWM